MKTSLNAAAGHTISYTTKNVLAVISDKVNLYGHNNTLDSARATAVSASDYYPFGLPMRGRNYQDEDYRYGFNGKEKDKSFANGNTDYDYGERVYVPSIGRFLRVDPPAKKYPSWSSYAFCLDNPIIWIAPTGMIVEPGSQKEWDKQKQNVVGERDRLQGRVDNLTAKVAEKGWSAEKLAGKIGDLNDRIGSLK